MEHGLSRVVEIKFQSAPACERAMLNSDPTGSLELVSIRARL